MKLSRRRSDEGSDVAVYESVTDAEGRYRFEAVPWGPVELSVSALGFQPQSWQDQVRADMPEQPPRILQTEISTRGILRGLIRSFQSVPLEAEVDVTSLQGKLVARGHTDGDGRFELVLPSGTYWVIVRAEGHKPHRRQVAVSDHGVAILNVDLAERGSQSLGR